jgi:hypothetical protein
MVKASPWKPLPKYALNKLIPAIRTCHVLYHFHFLRPCYHHHHFYVRSGVAAAVAPVWERIEPAFFPFAGAFPSAAGVPFVGDAPFVEDVPFAGDVPFVAAVPAAGDVLFAAVAPFAAYPFAVCVPFVGGVPFAAGVPFAEVAPLSSFPSLDHVRVAQY